MNKVKIIIVDDHAMLRDGVRALLGFCEDIEIVGEASNGKESIKVEKELVPDVVLMDLAMPGMDGLEATRLMKKQNPSVKVLAFTQYEDNEHVLSAIKAGACGYITKKAIGPELVTAIRIIHRGDTFLYPPATKALIEGYMQRVKAERHDHLTAREQKILKLVAAGHTSRKIGDILYISLRTVQGHRAQIAKKLRLRNRTELIKYTMRKGLISIDTQFV